MGERFVPTTIKAYIDHQLPEKQDFLEAVYAAITESAGTEVEETIKWGMPTFVYKGKNLVHFAAEKNHIGFHCSQTAVEYFGKQLLPYMASKATARIPYEYPLPLNLIKEIVRFRMEEQEQEGRGIRCEAKPRDRYEMPDYIKDALEAEQLTEAYEARPPYQRNDYIGWIERAKRPQTKEKRLHQMLEELRAADSYMGMAYNAKKQNNGVNE